MMWLKRLMYNWVREYSMSAKERRAEVPVSVSTGDEHISTRGATTVTIADAINGQVVQLKTYVPSKQLHHDGEWKTTTYVLKHGDDVVEAVAALLVNNKLK